MSLLSELKRDMQRLASPTKAQAAQRFFKSGKGEYGHGDKFLGLTVPEQRKIARQYRTLLLRDILMLLKSSYHEHRLTALLILVSQFERGDDATQKKIVSVYLKHTKYVNNWDLVDSSAPYILGTWLLTRPRTVLSRLAQSEILWERRIAVIATQAFIRQGQFTDTLRLAKLLLSDQHDLMHKAVGWMLREVGDRDKRVLIGFLKQHATRMPRTMLRYAIEKFPEPERKKYLRLKA